MKKVMPNLAVIVASAIGYIWEIKHDNSGKTFVNVTAKNGDEFVVSYKQGDESAQIQYWVW